MSEVILEASFLFLSHMIAFPDCLIVQWSSSLHLLVCSLQHVDILNLQLPFWKARSYHWQKKRSQLKCFSNISSVPLGTDTVVFLFFIGVQLIYHVVLLSAIQQSDLSYVHQFRSVAQSCLTLCDPHESQHARPPCPSLLPKFTQTHVHRISDVSSPSPPAPNPSQHQSLFQ